MISSLELAKLCKVSQGTVDRALHDRPGISIKTRDRILRIAAEHGYQANPVATEMMQGKSIIVGGLVPSLNSVFFMDLFQTISRKLDALGFAARQRWAGLSEGQVAETNIHQQL